MNYKDILAMGEAYKKVAEAECKTPKKEAMDPVDAKELKGKHKDRKDKDIDNDGDVDKSDEYLHKRRKAVSASIKGKKKGTEVETEVQESVELDELSKKTLGSYVKKASSDNATRKKEVMKPLPIKDIDKNIAMHRKFKKREGDISKAADKLAKESVELDELSKKTLGSYINKSHRNYDKQRTKQGAAYDKAARTGRDDDEDKGHEYGRKADNRTKGIKTAVNKLTKEAKDHGNTDNGSPRGEGLSPSAKKELDRTTPMNPATDELAVNNLNFKTFKAMGKKAPKRTGDNDAGDKKAIASATSVKEELDLSDFTQEEIIDFMMTEDFAQLDELSKNTLSSYLKKAAKSKNAAIDKADKIKYNNAGTGSEMAPRSKKALDKHNKTIDKRTKGIGSFMKRDQAKANPEYVHKPSATDRYKDGSAPSMTNKPASALHKSYKDRK